MNRFVQHTFLLLTIGLTASVSQASWNEGAPCFKGTRVFGATPDRDFRFSFSLCGSREELKFNVSKGVLPTGVILDGKTGVLAGRTKACGEYRMTVSAKNREGESSCDFTLVIGDNARSLTPPMGWTSWNALTDDVDQNRVMAAAKALVMKGLAAHGYQYVNVDSCWQGQRTANGTLALQPNSKFPDMAGLVQGVHSLGLKAGIYSTPMVTAWGSTPQMVYRGGSDYPLDRAYFHPHFGGCGSVGYEICDARQFAEWEFDWLKYDWPDTDVEHARRMRKALDATGRDIVMQLCTDCKVSDAEGFARYASSVRGNLDTHDDWRLMLGKHNCFRGVDPWLSSIRPGFWYDLDMLVVGSMRIDRKEPSPRTGEPLPPSFANRLTRDELVSHFAWWAIVPCPLFLSCDLERIDDFTLELVTNDDLIAINQDYPAAPASYEDYESGSKRLWTRKLSDGRVVLGFFNLNGDVWKVKRALGKAFSVRDVLSCGDLGRTAELNLTIPVHGCRVFLLGDAVIR